jgi:DUF4097 and DUF4098 domain-containing protein YvlB
MHRLLTLFTGVTLVALVATPALAQERRREREQRRTDTRETQTDRQTRTLNIGAEGELDLSNIAGDIVVTRGGGNAVTLEIVKTARGQDAASMLPLVTVDIIERGNRAEVQTRYPDGDELHRRFNRRNINVDVSFTIVAPTNTRLVLKSISGSINVKDIAGALTLESTSGSVSVANAGRTVTAKSISGDVEALDTKIDGRLEAGTISGTVRVRRTSARGLTLSSVSGAVEIEDSTSDRVEAQSVSGDVGFRGDLEPNGRYEFGSHSGSVKVALGGKTGFQVQATSFSGSITSDFPITLQGNQGRRQHNVRGVYGNGAAVLEITAFSGSILITKR